MKHIIKTTFAATILLLIFTSKIFATGAGVQIGAVPGIYINQASADLEKFSGTIVGTMKLSRVPMVVGAGFEGGKYFSDFDIGFSAFADYWFFDYQLINTWNLFSGFGASGKLFTSNFKDWNLAAGARFFAGVNCTFWDGYMEVYAQQNIVPTYIANLKKINSGSFMLCLPFETGVRLHF